MSSWLEVSASDYEGHMSDPTVDQLSLIGNHFQSAINQISPQAICVLGCATGNGFEYISPDTSVIGVDINSKYLEVLRKRYKTKLPNIELINESVENCSFLESSFDLIYAALILEFVNPATLMPRIYRWVRPGGNLKIMIQLASPNVSSVSSTRYSSMAGLAEIQTLHDPETINSLAVEAGFSVVEAETVRHKKGKEFYVCTYAKQMHNKAFNQKL